MKKLLLILLCLPMIGFGQDSEATEPNKQIIKIKPIPLLLGDLSVSYEREIVNKHSLTIGIPLYFKRDIAKMTIIKSLALLTPLLVDEEWDKDDVEDILDDAERIGSLGGYGIVFKYKWYLNKNTEALTGFYFSPEYYFRKFNIDIDASVSDLEDLEDNNNSPFDSPQNGYELEGDIKINTISFNFGHQWIRDWFSVDLHIGLAHYDLQYDFEEESGFHDNDEDDRGQMWLPRMGLNLGVAF